MRAFPLVAEFLGEKHGTLYVLADAPVRLRDAVSVVALVRFFAAHGVQLEVKPILAKHRRFLSALDVRRAVSVGETPALRQRVDGLVRAGVPLAEVVDVLFAEAESRDEGGTELFGDHQPMLAPRGPVIVLGRPQIYPPSFLDQVQAELRASSQEIYGRFKMPYPEPHPDPASSRPRFWTVEDTHYNITRDAQDEPGAQHDFGIVRKIRGAFGRRIFRFAYGTSSIGTVGAAQMLVDEDQNERSNRIGLDSHLNRYGEVEILIEVKRASDSSRRIVSYRDYELTPSGALRLRGARGADLPRGARVDRPVEGHCEQPSQARTAVHRGGGAAR